MLKFAAALALATIAAAVPALAAPTIAAHTTAVVFNAKSMRVTARQNGFCWTRSIASRRSDAYRCMVVNSIHDPCFTLSQNTVACPADGAKNTGVVIRLTKPLPEPNPLAGNAWQMKLVSGAVCSAPTGTTVPGFPYYCTGSLVCTAPPPGEPSGAVFVKCARTSDGKTGTAGSYLVTTLYE